MVVSKLIREEFIYLKQMGLQFLFVLVAKPDHPIFHDCGIGPVSDSRVSLESSI